MDNQDLSSGSNLDTVLNAPAEPTAFPAEPVSTPSVIPSDAQFVDPGQTAQPPPVIVDPVAAAALLAPLVPAVTPEPPKPAAHTVPLSELLETRAQTKAAKEALQRSEQERQQLLEMVRQFAPQQQQRQPQQPQYQPIDPNVDPAGALMQLREEAAQALRARDEFLRTELQRRDEEYSKRELNNHLNSSQRDAERAYGKEVVTKALDAAVQSGFGPTFREQADPYGAMVQWYRAQEVAQKIGHDPAAYEANLRKQITEQVTQQIVAQLKTGKPVPANIPPSLGAATRAAASAGDVVVGTKDFFNSDSFTNTPKRG